MRFGQPRGSERGEALEQEESMGWRTKAGTDLGLGLGVSRLGLDSGFLLYRYAFALAGAWCQV